MLFAVLLSACDVPTDATAPTALTTSPPPPELHWQIPGPLESPCRTGCLVGEDGALYASAYDSEQIAVPFLRGTIDPAHGLLTWTPHPTNGRRASRVLHAADIDGDGDVEWLAALRDASAVLQLEVYTPESLLLQSTTRLGVGAPDYPTSLRTLQDDADPALEVLLVARGTAWVFDDDGTQLRELVAPDCERSGHRLFTLDTLRGPELLTCDGVLYRADLQPFARIPGAVAHALALDADGDGTDDLLVTPDRATWRLVDGATGRVRWASTLPTTAVDVRPFDVDADGQEEIVFAIQSSLGHGLLALDPRTGARRHLLPMGRPTLAPTALQRVDHDHDGVDSLLVVGLANSGIFGWRSVSGQPEPTWGRMEGRPGLHNLTAMGDFHPAPGLEIALVGTDTPAYEVVLLDLSGQQLSATAFTRRQRSSGGGSAEAGDVDGDGFDELAVMTQGHLQILRLHPAPDVIGVDAEGLVDMGDVDGDGRDELLVVRDQVVHLLRPGRPPLPVPDVPARAFLYDLDGDGREEVLCPLATRGLEIRDAATGQVRQTLPTPVLEVVAGTSPSGDTRVWGKTYPGRSLVSWEVRGGQLVPAWAPILEVSSWETSLLPVGDGLLVSGPGSAASYVDPIAREVVAAPSHRRPLRSYAAAIPGLFVASEVLRTSAWTVP